MMKRILIIGSGGAGKSTLSRQLSEMLGIDVVHLDVLYWKPGWIQSEEGEWESRLRSAIRRESWIMDGNYSRTLPERLAACDTVVFLDLPRLVCVWRVLKRALRYRGRTRLDMPEGCPERIDFEFLRWIWNYPNRTRRKVLSMLEEHRDSKQVIRLTSGRAVEKFVAKQAAA